MIFSVSCGCTHLHWATHYGCAQAYSPAVFWRTPRLDASEVKGRDAADLLRVLSRGIPDEPHDYVFGLGADATAENALAQARRRAVPHVSVYVVGADRVEAQNQKELLDLVWGAVPSRITSLVGDDFFISRVGSDGCGGIVGAQGMAALRGAAHLHGHPALVFDGGPATTYAATNGAGRLLGGGIGPGIQRRFHALDARTDISAQQVLDRLEKAREEGRPIPTFAATAHEAMMTDAFQDFALKGRHVVERWLEETGVPAGAAEDAPANADRRVVCAGGDGDVLMQLLQPGCGGLIEHVPNPTTKRGALGPRYQVEVNKHLVHYGVAAVLAEEEDREEEDPEESGSGATEERRMEAKTGREEQEEAMKEREAMEAKKARARDEESPREGHVGQRVAKRFDVDDGDGIFRGTVDMAAAAGFHIKYDDGDSEDVLEGELEEMRELFAVHGEKVERKPQRAALLKGKKLVRPSADKKTMASLSIPAKPAKKTAKEARKRAARDASVAVVPRIAAATNKNTEEKETAAKKEEKKKTEVKAERTPRAEEKGVQKPKRPQAPAAESTAMSPRRRASPPSKNPDAKKPKAVNSAAAPEPRSFIGKKIAKDFDGNLYFGTVKDYDDSEAPAFWHVEYDDGDEEDYNEKDLIKALKYYNVKEKKVKTQTEAKVKGTQKDTQKPKRVQAPTVESTASSPRRKAPTPEKKSNAKKLKTVESAVASEPQGFVGKRIAKDFGGELYFGTVMDYDDSEESSFWHVKYDDGDEEDYFKKDIIKALKYYKTKEKKDEAKTEAKVEAKVKGTPRAEEEAQKPKRVQAPSAESTVRSPRKRASTSEDKYVAQKPMTIERAVASEPKSFVGKRIAKDFGGDPYFGIVMDYDDSEAPSFWHVKYDDGDEEDYFKKDLIKALKYYKVKEKKAETKTEAKADAKVKGTPSAEEEAQKLKRVQAPAAESMARSPRQRASTLEKKHVAKKPKTVESSAASEPQTFVGKRIAKDFGDDLHFGTVMEYDDSEAPSFWHVEYDDGDEEDYFKEDVIKALKYYEVKKKVETKREVKAQNTPCAEEKERTRKAEKVSEPVDESATKSSKRRMRLVPQEKKPVAKKPKMAESAVVSEPHSFVGKRIAKDFSGDLYFGTVMDYDDTEEPAVWHVEYDDGDNEDYFMKDLIEALKYYHVKGERDKKKNSQCKFPDEDKYF